MIVPSGWVNEMARANGAARSSSPAARAAAKVRTTQLHLMLFIDFSLSVNNGRTEGPERRQPKRWSQRIRFRKDKHKRHSLLYQDRSTSNVESTETSNPQRRKPKQPPINRFKARLSVELSRAAAGPPGSRV